MRIDVITIFPDYLSPLKLSLTGKAREAGLLDVRVHDLREWATDRHRTVDGTPAGGGAGMVMRPEPWGAAFDALEIPGATMVVPTPSGLPMTQELAEDLAARERLIFACGRYEGIDQRVIDYANSRCEVVEVSLGDYVVNGGEVAALAIIEAVARLLPGFMGNPESLVEESHQAGLLEYPVYTTPAVWRDLAIPPVLLSGNHGEIAAWRHDQSLRRTAQRRPDLAHPGRTISLDDLADAEIRLAQPADAGELLTLQRACWVQESQANPGVHIEALHEDLAQVASWLTEWLTLVVRHHGRLIGAARGQERDGVWHIGRLMVAPDLQGRGLGRFLLREIEEAAPAHVTSYTLFTGAGSIGNLRAYKRAGYRRTDHEDRQVVRLAKSRAGARPAIS
jgi:tRNA (guanine37-N1)-methyltransferase